MKRGLNALRPKNHKGQVLLIVVLVMIVALTVGLSVISRSITNIKNSTQQAQSQKALSAAEAGVEQAIKSTNGTNIASSFGANSSYSTTITPVSGTNLLAAGGNPVVQDQGADIWLINHNPDGSLAFGSSNPMPQSLTFYWGLSSDTCLSLRTLSATPALEIAVVSGATQWNSVITRYAVDPCSTRRSSNKFLSAVVGSFVPVAGGPTFSYSYTVTVAAGLDIRVIPLYSSSVVAVTDTVALPKQGTIINSTGNSGSTSRAIEVFQGYPELPSEYFLYGIFAPS